MTTENPPVRRRLDALDRQAWAFIAAGLAGLALTIKAAVSVLEGGAGAGAVALFGLFSIVCYLVVRERARPELIGECEECGRELTVDSARDRYDHAVTVQFSGPPERSSVGPLPVIAERNRQRRQFCSPTCARMRLGPLREEREAEEYGVTPEVAA